MQTFWIAVKDRIPAGVSLQVQNSGDVIDEASGELTGGWTGGTPPDPTVGTGSGGYAANAGFLVQWGTGAVVGGHRVKGRTFIVPAIQGAYDGDGTVDAATISIIGVAATTLVTALGGSMRVWHRPVGGSGGQALAVTSALVPDRAVQLKSRRD